MHRNTWQDQSRGSRDGDWGQQEPYWGPRSYDEPYGSIERHAGGARPYFGPDRHPAEFGGRQRDWERDRADPAYESGIGGMGGGDRVSSEHDPRGYGGPRSQGDLRAWPGARHSGYGGGPGGYSGQGGWGSFGSGYDAERSGRSRQRYAQHDGGGEENWGGQGERGQHGGRDRFSAPWSRSGGPVSSFGGGPSGGAYSGGGGGYERAASRGAGVGKGPKGYKRSDERIREEVSDMLLGAYELDAEGIEVSVSSGEVTLSGHVASRNDKWEAEQLASAVLGVDEVINQLRVKRWRDEPSQSSADRQAPPRSDTEGTSAKDPGSRG